MLTTKAREKQRCRVNIQADVRSDGGGSRDISVPGRRVMTTPRQRQQIHNEGNKYAHHKQNRTTTTAFSKIRNRCSDLFFFCCFFYLFLSCCEFYLPALIGHTAALVEGPNHVISSGRDGASAGRGRHAPPAVLKKKGWGNR